MYSQEAEFVVELKITKGQLSAINKLLGFAYSPTARKTIKPQTTIESLIKAIEKKQIEIQYYER